MSNTKKNVEFKVGLTVIVGLLILLLGIFWGKNYRLVSQQWRVSFLFQNTGGLRVNDPVTVNGVKKGQVDAIELQYGAVRVDVMLDRDVKLFTDARAYITTVELMGGKKVEIYPGTSEELLDLANLQSPLRGAQTAGFSEMMMQLGEMSQRAGHLMARLDSTVTLAAAFLDHTTVRQPLIAALTDLQISTASLRQFVQNNQAGMQGTVDNLEATSSQLRALVESRTPEVDSTLLVLNRTAKKLDEFTATLDDISLRLQRRQGTLGNLIYDDELYVRLNSAVTSVDSTLVELRSNLGKLLNGSNFNLINLLSF
jgi:phospholipid/cholesterol/gamma-HCH transport system substrate-binding protein